MNNSSALRVLFVSHTYIVGVNQAKLNAIAATGEVEVGLLTPRRWQARSWKKRLELERPYSQLQLYPASVFPEGYTSGYLHSPLRVWQTLQAFQPDLIQVEQEVTAVSAFEMALWSRLYGIPLSVFCWENMDKPLSPLRRSMRQFVLQTADLLLPGNQEGAELVRKWGYTGRLEVMPQLGVDTQLFTPNPQKTKDSVLRIGYVGRLVYQKGIDLLFTAAKQLRDRGHACEIILCGTGLEEDQLKQEAIAQGIADCVTWQGAVRHDEVPAKMRQFDLLVLPSRSDVGWKEQFGHVLIEAMATGIPVIGSTCGEIPNVVGRADLVFPEGDAEGLAAILERMICETDWWQAAGEYSLQRVNQLYTHEVIADRLVRLWRTVLTAKQPVYSRHSQLS